MSLFLIFCARSSFLHGYADRSQKSGAEELGVRGQELGVRSEELGVRRKVSGVMSFSLVNLLIRRGGRILCLFVPEYGLDFRCIPDFLQLAVGFLLHLKNLH